MSNSMYPDYTYNRECDGCGDVYFPDYPMDQYIDQGKLQMDEASIFLCIKCK